MATRTFERPNRDESPDLLNRWLARAYTINWEAVAYAVILIAAILTRFVNLGARVMSHDESLHTYYSWRLETAGDFQHTPLMHGPILFHITALMYFLFGDSDFSARIYPALLGIILVMMPILFKRWLGRWGALLVSVMFLISPLLMYYNRYIREDTPCYVAALFMMYAIFQYIDGPSHLRRRARWLYLMAGAMLWCLASKESAFIYIAIFGSFTTLYWLARVFQEVRRKPSKNLFNFVIVGTLVGTLFMLGMTMVFTIALSNSAGLPARLTYLGDQFRLLVSGGQVGFEFTAFISWTLIVVALVLALVIGTVLWATRRGGRLRVSNVVVLLLLALVVGLALIAVEEYTTGTKITAEEAETVSVETINNLPLYAAWAVGIVGVAGILLIWVRGWWRKFYRFPEFDVLIVMGSMILPWLTAAVVKASGADPTDYSPLGIQRTAFAIVPFIAVAVVAGLTWNWKRWLLAALVFHIPFAFFFTTMFTNPQGLASGMVGSLGYWLNQQGVQRGSQPRYYYALAVMPIYEYLPIVGSILAMLAGMVRFWRLQVRQPEPVPALDEFPTEGELSEPPAEEKPRIPARLQPGGLNRFNFPLFAAWCAVFNFLAYTLAGEKMPWLGVHLTIPLIFLTGWYFGRVFSNIDWATFRARGWLYLILIPLFGVAVFQALSPFLTGNSPFLGLERQQQAQFNQWLAVIAVGIIVAYLIVMVIIRTGFLHFRRMVGVALFLALSVLTFRHAFMASFVNYDYANEFLVYAHAAPGIKLMMQQIEEVSERTTDGMNLKFAWGGNAWPVTWYFRDLTNATFYAGNPTPQSFTDAVMVYASDDVRSRVEPLLEDRYYKFEYIRMWWPDQEYFYLTPQRVENALDLRPENTQAAQIRRGMFDIWWGRNYTTYGQAINKDYSLQNWPVSEKFALYVRKDVAAQVWNLGTGDATVLNPLDNQAVNVCTNNWQQKAASVVFSSPTALNHPLDIAVDDIANKVYVAEEFNNRVSVFDRNGAYLTAIQGGTGDFIDSLNRPNGVAVAPNSSLYIADTWNFFIREFTPQGNLVTTWGQPGQFGADAPVDPVDGFWGPRDVEVDGDGNVYVADTGNKRIRVYDANGTYRFDIGSAGAELGQLNEPSGMAVDKVNRLLYVADTWNRRVSVFDLQGNPRFTFDVRGWYEDLGNRPYMAIDQLRHLLYVTDPDAGRVLVYDLTGNCVGSFGQPSDAPADNTQFDTIGGIATDGDGNVYVTDSAAGRILKFAPFVDTVMPAPQLSELDSGAQQDELETVEVLPPQDESLAVTAEATVEAAG